MITYLTSVQYMNVIKRNAKRQCVVWWKSSFNIINNNVFSNDHFYQAYRLHLKCQLPSDGTSIFQTMLTIWVKINLFHTHKIGEIFCSNFLHANNYTERSSKKRLSTVVITYNVLPFLSIKPGKYYLLLWHIILTGGTCKSLTLHSFSTFLLAITM